MPGWIRTCRKHLNFFKTRGKVGILESGTFSSSDAESYTAANSITRFLLTRGDASTVIEFAMQGKRNNWDAAAHRFYGASLSQIQREWEDWVRQPRLAAR